MIFAALPILVGLFAAPDAAPLTIPYERYVLAQNGLEVILHQDHDLPVVAVNIWYHAGPKNEAPGRTGFAHLFEHLMFQGSKHVKDDEHFKRLESAGASLVNGTTDFDRTNYLENVPANQLPLALWLESDRMGFLLDTLTQAKLDNQRDVVMNERRQSVENTPYGLSDEKVMQTLFPPEHPYFGDVIGSMDDLKAATLDDVRDFFNRYYSPANATLVLAGDFDADAAKALIERYFGTLPRRPTPTARHIETPAITKERRAVVKEPVGLPRVVLAWLSAPAFAPGDADADVLAFILGSGRASRLHKRLVYDLEIATQVAVSQESLALTSVFRVVVVGRPGVDASRLEAETQAVLDAIKKEAPSAREVERARNQLVTRMVTALQLSGGFSGRAEMLNRYNQYLGEPDFFAKDIARYRDVTPQSVRAFALSLLETDHRAVVVTVPTP
ncbi:MAG: insulinase family protein [Deltaproteobacteria bacterium]|nr:insulinase family protein [Deltaproteobacteria bacterium]